MLERGTPEGQGVRQQGPSLPSLSFWAGTVGPYLGTSQVCGPRTRGAHEALPWCPTIVTSLCGVKCFLATPFSSLLSSLWGSPSQLSGPQSPQCPAYPLWPPGEA
jgi:hypothetical protein